MLLVYFVNAAAGEVGPAARSEVLQEEVRGAPARCCARRHAAIVERD
jgi:hypothetical protein